MEPLKHECGVAMVRLLKPLDYYKKKYGTDEYGLNKLYLLMEKQHNRGQEGAGVACVKLGAYPGDEFMFREREDGNTAIGKVFERIHKSTQLEGKPFIGEAYMGHLRYSTTGRRGMEYIHPFLRRNNWRVQNLALCGNFNLTNTRDIYASIVAHGQHPRKYADTYILLEQLGHRLDREVERVYNICKRSGLQGLQLTYAIEERVNLANVLRTASAQWDGGYVMCGLTGSGEQFVLRDPWGIRTAFWYEDEEVMVIASERPVIQTAFNVPVEKIHELQPGQALLTSKRGVSRLEQINDAVPVTRACSFERIYFSRGSDVDIYHERKMLGRMLLDRILPAIYYDIEHTVFSYIPNTAEAAFFGLLEGVENYLSEKKMKQIEALDHKPTQEELQRILGVKVRAEKVAIKDIKLRTFISEGNTREDLAAHVYDITYGSLTPHVDNLVIIDDSIVRGTTLRQSIIKILDRLQPKRIIIVSSSPQIRYPDYYGIDMSSMQEFVAFRAAVALLKERGMQHVIDGVYANVRSGIADKNHIREIYAPFSEQEISDKITELLTPPEVKTEIKIIFQSVQGLHKACPNHTGDWYFTGDYPTPGGLKLLNSAFLDYMEAK